MRFSPPLLCALVAGVFGLNSMAQDAVPPAQSKEALQPAVPAVSETMVVVGTAAPVPLADANASVLVLPVEQQQLRFDTPASLLREDASIFLEQRGAGGAQNDIALRGGSFAQTLVLVNGFRVNDAQTAHHNLDLPIPLEAMHDIQVLHGAGSTLHGEDALSGVVDFLTAAPSRGSLLLRAGGGSFGENEQALMAGGLRGRWSARVTGDRNFSTGFMKDRDYRNEDASLETWAGSALGTTDLLFAAGDRAFGADQFYGPYPSWERTKSWFASARQELGAKTVGAFGYRRHTDNFVLFRDDPAIYANNHIDSSWQASLRRTEHLRDAAVLFGMEEDGDTIRSNNLGMHARNRGAGYVDLDLHPGDARWTLSAGAREEVFSGGEEAFAPHLAGSWRVAQKLKARAGGGYGFRIPTYTDLYYSDPTTIGNAHLRPESAWSGEAGLDWAARRALNISATGFYSLQHNAIDYIRANPSVKWQAENLTGLRFAGVETNATWQPGHGQEVQVSWTALFGAQDALHGMQSEYVFNYPVNNAHILWTAALGRGFVLSNGIQIAERYQQTAYPVWDAALVRSRGVLRPYVRMQNASNTGYAEITDVRMPGRTVMGGFALSLGR